MVSIFMPLMCTYDVRIHLDLTGEHGDVPRCPNLLRKNASTSQRATALYFWNFCKIWVSRNVFMFRKVRSKCRRTLYVHITGTKIELNHQAEKSPFQLYFTDVSSELKNSKNRDFFKNFIFVKKLKRFGSNSSNILQKLY